MAASRDTQPIYNRFMALPDLQAPKRTSPAPERHSRPAWYATATSVALAVILGIGKSLSHHHEPLEPTPNAAPPEMRPSTARLPPGVVAPTRSPECQEFAKQKDLAAQAPTGKAGSAQARQRQKALDEIDRQAGLKGCNATP